MSIFTPGVKTQMYEVIGQREYRGYPDGCVTWCARRWQAWCVAVWWGWQGYRVVIVARREPEVVE